MENKPLTPARMAEMRLAQYIDHKFKLAMSNKMKYTKLWNECMDAWKGVYKHNQNVPDYKSTHTSNYIFKTLETIRPIMLDNNPKFQSLPRNKEGMAKANAINLMMQYEYDRERMPEKLQSQIISFLVTGNMLFYVPWNSKKGKNGETEYIPVNINNFFPDPMATEIEDGMFHIYATYKPVNEVKNLFPHRAKEIEGENVKYEELLKEKRHNDNSKDQVLILEAWLEDYAYVEIEEERSDGMYKGRKKKYPNGRRIIVAPELGLVLRDGENPYNDSRYPFVLIKNYDIPFELWGMGDVEQLLSPQKYMDEMLNIILDNAKSTGNAQWIMDKNSGIGRGVVTNRPGLVLRKNPGSEVRREPPLGIPAYMQEMTMQFQRDMEAISGVHDASSGERPVGIQAGNAIQALQEAGQTRIRMKTRMMEMGLGKMASMGYSRNQQFWKNDRFIRFANEEGKIDFQEIKASDLVNDYDFKIVAGSTMPSNKQAQLQNIISLAQTQAEDGLPMVDREAVMQYVEIAGKQDIVKRMAEKATNVPQEEVMAMQQQYQQESEEMKAIIEELSNVVEETSTDVQEMQKEHESIMGDVAQMESDKEMLNAREKAFEDGKKAGVDNPQATVGDVDEERFTNEVQNDIIPSEVLDELAGMDDTALQELLDAHPELEEMLNKVGGEGGAEAK